MADPDRVIPEESRRTVERRQRLRCLRCGGAGSEWHHRRSRRVRAAHRHCPCNGVLLCGSCHRWAHANHEEARATGFIVSQWVDEPSVVPLMTPWGWSQIDCVGDEVPLSPAQIVTDGMGGYVVDLNGLAEGFPVE